MQIDIGDDHFHTHCIKTMLEEGEEEWTRI